MDELHRNHKFDPPPGSEHATAHGSANTHIPNQSGANMNTHIQDQTSANMSAAQPRRFSCRAHSTAKHRARSPARPCLSTPHQAAAVGLLHCGGAWTVASQGSSSAWTLSGSSSWGQCPRLGRNTNRVLGRWSGSAWKKRPTGPSAEQAQAQGRVAQGTTGATE